MEWACDNVPCECKFEQSITLGGPGNTGAQISATLHNQRSDTAQYPPLNQELLNGKYWKRLKKDGMMDRIMPAKEAYSHQIGDGQDAMANLHGPRKLKPSRLHLQQTR